MVVLAYPNNDKAMYLARVRAHREADELVRGTGWQPSASGGYGCSVGCSIHEYSHERYAELLGVPAVIARLQDWLFENLPKDHLLFPERFLDAIQPGADLSLVWNQWCERMLTRCIDYVGVGEEPRRVECRKAVTRVRDLHARAVRGGIVADEEWASAAGASWASWSASASWAAGASRAAWAAWASASASWAAGAASGASGASGEAAGEAASGACDAEIVTQANDLIELLQAVQPAAREEAQ